MASRTLEMGFTNSSGKKVTIRVADARTDLTAEQVRNTMDLIISRNIFTSSGGDLIERASAQVVVRDSQELNMV